MGQAKQRGTFEQRRQSAIAKTMPDASPSTLNRTYKERRPSYPRGGLTVAMMVAAMLSFNPRA